MKKYRILPLLLLVCLLLASVFPAAAVTSADGVPQSTIQAEEGSYVLGSDAVKSALDEKLGANCVLLADEDSGQYYYTRNIDAKAYPASLTKIMTLLLAVEAVERGDVQLDDTVTAYADCNADMVEGASNADIKVGETMTFEDFLYCAMISSANEACNVVAEYVCGSISAFVQRMNARAQGSAARARTLSTPTACRTTTITQRRMTSTASRRKRSATSSSPRSAIRSSTPSRPRTCPTSARSRTRTA